MEAVVSCKGTVRCAVDCSQHLGLLQALPGLQELFVWLSRHSEDQGGRRSDHGTCLDALPTTLQHLKVGIPSD